MAGFALDCRVAARGLWKARGFAAVVIITLGLGTGASSAMFSVLRATLFRPPPFPDADRLVVISLDESEGTQTPRRRALPVEAIDYVRRNASSFEGVAAYTVPHVNIAGYDQPERLECELISANYLRTLGVSTAAGRGFVAGDDSVTGSAPLVVLGHELWQRRFGGDPAIIGKQLSVNRTSLLVVGIMPPGFRGVSGRGELWIPLTMAPAIAFPYRSFSVIARLAPDRTLDQARSELRVIGARLQEIIPADERASDQPAVSRTLTPTPLGEARVDVANRRPVLTLFGAVGVLLLIACANTATLFLVRAAARAREVAVRMAIGSSRARLVRLLLTESTLIALVGGALGLVLGSWAVSVMSRLVPPRAITSGAFGTVGDFSAPGLDLAVVGFTWITTMLVAIAFGLAPAVRAASTEPADALRSGGLGSTPARRQLFGVDLYGALTVIEIALAVVLLAGSGLLLRSLWRLESMPLGFQPERVTTFQIQAPPSWYPAAEAPALIQRLVERVSSVPGVDAVAASYYTPFDPGAVHRLRRAEAGPAAGEHDLGHHYVTPDYFRALGIPLLRGRLFTPDDRLGRPPVGVVSAAAARRIWPGEDPVGKRFYFTARPSLPTDSAVEVIGVVGDVQYRPSPYRVEPDVYTPYYQFASLAYALVMVKSPVPQSTLVPALRDAVSTVDQQLPLSELGTMDERGDRLLARRRLNAVLLAVFAGIALAIATVGVYGVLSHLSAQRTREFGIRIALGAAGADVLRHVLGRALVLLVSGLALGILGALLLTRVLASQLYDVTPTDPTTFTVISAILAAAALTASYLPARRAARVDPLTALRAE